MSPLLVGSMISKSCAPVFLASIQKLYDVLSLFSLCFLMNELSLISRLHFQKLPKAGSNYAFYEDWWFLVRNPLIPWTFALMFIFPIGSIYFLVFATGLTLKWSSKTVSLWQPIAMLIHWRSRRLTLWDTTVISWLVLLATMLPFEKVAGAACWGEEPLLEQLPSLKPMVVAANEVAANGPATCGEASTTSTGS